MSKQIEQKWTIVHPEFRCDMCGGRILQGEHGYVQVDDHRARDLQNKYRSRQVSRQFPWEPINLALVEPKEFVKWQAVHDRCAPMKLAGYFFYTTDLQTFEEVLQTNFHLAQKKWLAYTDWPHFLQRQLAPYDG